MTILLWAVVAIAGGVIGYTGGFVAVVAVCAAVFCTCMIYERKR